MIQWTRTVHKSGGSSDAHFIGPKSDHCFPCLPIRHSCSRDLIDMTVAGCWTCQLKTCWFIFETEVLLRCWSWFLAKICESISSIRILMEILNIKFGQKEYVKKSFTFNATLAEFYGFPGLYGYDPFWGNKAFILNGIRTLHWVHYYVVFAGEQEETPFKML